MARRPFASRGRTIDYKQWSSVPGLSADVAAAGNQGGSQLAFTFPATILRIRGGGHIGIDGGADGAANNVTVGIGIVSTDAATLGATALPDPQDEPEYDWMWWRELNVKRIVQTAETDSDIAGTVRWVIDSKAMRKVKPGQSLIMIFQTGTTTAIDIEMEQLRVLIGT